MSNILEPAQYLDWISKVEQYWPTTKSSAGIQHQVQYLKNGWLHSGPDQSNNADTCIKILHSDYFLGISLHDYKKKHGDNFVNDSVNSLFAIAQVYFDALNEKSICPALDWISTKKLEIETFLENNCTDIFVVPYEEVKERFNKLQQLLATSKNKKNLIQDVFSEIGADKYKFETYSGTIHQYVPVAQEYLKRCFDLQNIQLSKTPTGLAKVLLNILLQYYLLGCYCIAVSGFRKRSQVSGKEKYKQFRAPKGEASFCFSGNLDDKVSQKQNSEVHEYGSDKGSDADSDSDENNSNQQVRIEDQKISEMKYGSLLKNPKAQEVEELLRKLPRYTCVRTISDFEEYEKLHPLQSNPLHMAAFLADSSYVKSLETEIVKSFAFKNNKKFETAIHIACKGRCKETLRAMLHSFDVKDIKLLFNTHNVKATLIANQDLCEAIRAGDKLDDDVDTITEHDSEQHESIRQISIEKWTPSMVLQFLGEVIGDAVNKYRDAFQENVIDGIVLQSLSDKDLHELGVELNHINVIKTRIAAILDNSNYKGIQEEKRRKYNYEEV